MIRILGGNDWWGWVVMIGELGGDDWGKDTSLLNRSNNQLLYWVAYTVYANKSAAVALSYKQLYLNEISD